MAEQDEKEVPHIARRLNWLFENIHKPDGSEYTMQDIEDITNTQGSRIAATSVWKIRNGHTKNPGYLTLRALANLFEVPVTFFYEGVLTPEEEMRLLVKPSTEVIALRAGDLDETQRQALLALIESMRNRK